MNKLVYVLITVLVIVLAALTFSQTEDEQLVLTHPLYEDGEIEEILITTYHAVDNIEQSSWAELVEDRGFDIYGDKIWIDVLVQEMQNGVVCANCEGYGLVTANAEITQRGQSSRLSEQKSFKIRYFSEASSYYGETELNLKKHYDDELRIKNKLVFDVIKEIPNTIVSNTKFVHLYVRDLNAGNPDIIDLGLFTHHEEVNEEFLIARGLNPEGNLYNINFFDFYRYEDVIMLESDPDYDKSDFEEYLEINLSDDHTELIAFLDAINSNVIPINSVVNTFLDRENYLTYLALNMLTDNIDSSARNFKLYRPEDSKKWYFIYWDMDKTFLPEDATVDQWRTGIHLYMNDALHSQFLKVDSNREELIQRVEELKPYFSKEIVQELVQGYDEQIRDVLTTTPDIEHLDFPYEEMFETSMQLSDRVEENYQKFMDSMNYPKAVFILGFEKKSDYHVLDWSESYDFDNEDVEYTVRIATDPAMTNIIFEESGIKATQVPVFELAPGSYFVQVDSTNEKGNTMQAYDRYKDSEGYIYLGVKNLVVV